MIRWRGRGERKEQVANACDSFVDLTPASDLPAEAVKSAWHALEPGQPIPLIGEIRYGDRDTEEDEFC